MPTYAYRCPANGRTIEVMHGMSEQMTTWADLCRRAEIDPGNTPSDAPVEKAVTLGLVRAGKGDAGGAAGPGPCGPSCGCHPG
jgi:hypothetical protein